MNLNLPKEVAALQRMTAKQLRERYAEVFGEATRANNRTWLVRRIAWRLQANVEGCLSERARRRAEELAETSDLRTTLPGEKPVSAPVTIETTSTERDQRLPPLGSVIVRTYKGRELRVTVRQNGFEFEGALYKTLSAVAKAITGSHCNGFLFFKLTKETE